MGKRERKRKGERGREGAEREGEGGREEGKMKISKQTSSTHLHSTYACIQAWLRVLNPRKRERDGGREMK